MTVNLSEEELRLTWRLWKAINQELAGPQLTNSELITGLGSEVLEIRNMARIVARRRGMQIIEGA